MFLSEIILQMKFQFCINLKKTIKKKKGEKIFFKNLFEYSVMMCGIIDSSGNN